MVFKVSIAIVLALVVLAGIVPGAFNAAMQVTLTKVISSAGWLYLLVVFLALVFLLYLAFGRLGKLRIGGENAEPEFSRTSWVAMMFAGGMGIGLVLRGAAEAISQFGSPPECMVAQISPSAYRR